MNYNPVLNLGQKSKAWNFKLSPDCFVEFMSQQVEELHNLWESIYKVFYMDNNNVHSSDRSREIEKKVPCKK